MLTLRLESHKEWEWLGENPAPGAIDTPLYHQWLTAIAEEPLIINTHNTGTGKTNAALARVARRARARGGALNPLADNVLFVAPTNALITQHARDARAFCERAGLPYRVVAITRADMDAYQAQPGFSEAPMRNGAARHHVLAHPRVLDEDAGHTATIFIVNPDIFYYALYFRYGQFDRIPLFQDLLVLCNFLIIDELHYYSPKQLACFLLFMQISRHFGFVTSAATQRQFCVLTATPDPRVTQVLERLGLPIAWVSPDRIPPPPPELVRATDALAPATLRVFNRADLQASAEDPDGLWALTVAEMPAIQQHLEADADGAIISSSLWTIQHIYDDLRGPIGDARLGRITGPESRAGREAAARRQLILATPTVDIGYNFVKEGGKARQNLDFLYCDARSSDEALQRIGRAARVLGKPVRHVASEIAIVLSSVGYAALAPFDGQTIARAALAESLIAALPPRADLFAYFQSEAIVEAFLPLYRIAQQTPADKQDDLQTLFTDLHALFDAGTSATYARLDRHIRGFLRQEEVYHGLYATHPADTAGAMSAVQKVIFAGGPKQAWMQPIFSRLRWARTHLPPEDRAAGSEQWTRSETFDWFVQDLAKYTVERARFAFREALQAPPAVIYDPQHLHTSELVAIDDAIRMIRFYQATYYATRAAWAQATSQRAPATAHDPEGPLPVALWCQLHRLKTPEERIQLGLRLQVDTQRDAWERGWANRVTALVGLQLVPLNDSGHGLPPEIRTILAKQLIPALVVRQQSHAANALFAVRQRAQFMVYDLAVTFAGMKTSNYHAVLGSMALQVAPEIRGALYSDRAIPPRDDEDIPVDDAIL